LRSGLKRLPAGRDREMCSQNRGGPTSGPPGRSLGNDNLPHKNNTQAETAGTTRRFRVVMAAVNNARICRKTLDHGLVAPVQHLVQEFTQQIVLRGCANAKAVHGVVRCRLRLTKN
jgi:hypothetical protein